MTTGATSIATSSTSPAEKACPPTSPAATLTSPSPASSLASAMPASTEAAVWNGASGGAASHSSGRGRGGEGGGGGGGEPPLGQRPVGDDDQLVAGGRLAVPAVRGVEQMAADHPDLDGVPEGLDVVGGRPRDAERPAARRGGQFGITVEVPVEQWTDRVV